MADADDVGADRADGELERRPDEDRRATRTGAAELDLPGQQGDDERSS
jgi:hypothetical protein